MKRVLKFILYTVLLLLFVEIGAAFYFYTEASLIKTRKGTEQLESQLKKIKGGKVWFNSLKVDTFSLESVQNYKIKGSTIQGNDSTNLTVILVHGITVDRWWMLKYAKIYTQLGANIVLYDHMGYGQSEGDFVSFGFYEKQDLQKVVEFTKKRFPNTEIGIHGESMGAATAIQHMGLSKSSKDIAFYIADCPYSDLYEQFSVRLSEDFGLSDLGLISTASLINYIRHDFWFGEVSPTKELLKSKAPLLLIHGKSDRYVPTYMSEKMHATHAESELLLVSKAVHARSVIVNPELYYNTVFEFVKKNTD